MYVSPMRHVPIKGSNRHRHHPLAVPFLLVMARPLCGWRRVGGIGVGGAVLDSEVTLGNHMHQVVVIPRVYQANCRSGGQALGRAPMQC